MSNYIIFGATSYLGQALVRLLSEDVSNKLMLVSRSKKDLFKDVLSDNIVEYSGYDLTESSSIEPLKHQIDSFFKRNEGFNVIASVGDFWEHYLLEEVDYDEAIRMTNSHYATVYCAALITLPPLRERKTGGNFITFSCNSVRYLYPRMAPYCAGKAAVEAFTQCMAHEYAQYGIVANCLRLSSLSTEETITSKPHGDSEHYMSPRELAKTICALCESPNAYVNGSIIELYEYSDSFYGQGYLERIAK